MVRRDAVSVRPFCDRPLHRSAFGSILCAQQPVIPPLGNAIARTELQAETYRCRMSDVATTNFLSQGSRFRDELLKVVEWLEERTVIVLGRTPSPSKRENIRPRIPSFRAA